MATFITRPEQLQQCITEMIALHNHFFSTNPISITIGGTTCIIPAAIPAQGFVLDSSTFKSLPTAGVPRKQISVGKKVSPKPKYICYSQLNHLSLDDKLDLIVGATLDHPVRISDQNLFQLAEKIRTPNQRTKLNRIIDSYLNQYATNFDIWPTAQLRYLCSILNICPIERSTENLIVTVRQYFTDQPSSWDSVCCKVLQQITPNLKSDVDQILLGKQTLLECEDQYLNVCPFADMLRLHLKRTQQSIYNKELRRELLVQFLDLYCFIQPEEYVSGDILAHTFGKKVGHPTISGREFEVIINDVISAYPRFQLLIGSMNPVVYYGIYLRYGI